MIFAIPLSTLFFFSLLKPGEALFFSASPAPGLSFFRGILFFIPALIVILFFKGLLPISYRSWRLYLFYLVEYHLLEFVLGVAGCFLLMRRHHEFIPVAFFLAGYYSSLSLYDLFMLSADLNLMSLFLLPAVRIFSLLFAAVLFGHYQEGYGLRRLLFMLLLFCIPVVGAMVTYFYMTFYLIYAVILAVVCFLGAITFLFAGKKLYLL
jgi:hypothetical protein